MRAGTQAGIAQGLHHGRAVFPADLQYRAKFLVEQHGDQPVAQAAIDYLRRALDAINIVHQRVVAEPVEIERDADMRGEAHLAHGCPQAAVGAIMVGEDHALAVQRLNRVKKGLERCGLGIRRQIAADAIDLGQGGAAEAVLTQAEVDQHQFGFTYPGIATQFRRQRAAQVRDRSKRRDDQRQRRSHLFLYALLLPASIPAFFPFGAH